MRVIETEALLELLNGNVDVVEQTEAAKVSAYHYRVTFKPETILPDIDLRTEGN